MWPNARVRSELGTNSLRMWVAPGLDVFTEFRVVDYMFQELVVRSQTTLTVVDIPP